MNHLRVIACEYELSSPVPIPANGALPIAFEPVPAGDYVISSEVLDVWGNSSVFKGPVKLEQAVDP